MSRPYEYRDTCAIYFVPPIVPKTAERRAYVPREVNVQCAPERCLDVAKTLATMGALRIVIMPFCYYPNADGQWKHDPYALSWECTLVPDMVRKRFQEAFPRHDGPIRFHPVDGFWSIETCGMFVGCEADGYVHS